MISTLAGHPGAGVAVPLVDGHFQVHAAAFRRAAAAPLADAFDRGERSLTRAIGGLEVVSVTHLDPSALVDVDSPSDLDR